MHSHIPVLFKETLEALLPASGKIFLDGTFGRGGHTRALLDAGVKVVALDWDDDAIEAGKQSFASELTSGQLILERANFGDLATVPAVLRAQPFDGMLFDFGVSSPQLDQPERGFSFQHDALLDMRMDRRLGVTAADLVNALGKRELSDMLKSYAQEQAADRIATAIVKARTEEPIRTTRQLAQIIEKTAGRSFGRGHLHPATKTFMALRMVVNGELQSIESMLATVLPLLRQGGRMATIAFQEMEDRLIKLAFRDWESKGFGTSLTQRPIEASSQEISENPRSRSAKLRVFVKGDQ